MTVRTPNTVLLVTPPYHCGMVESAGVWMPLGLAYLAGAVRRAGYDPEIYDAMSLFHDMAQIRAQACRQQPRRRRRHRLHGDHAGRARRPARGQGGVPGRRHRHRRRAPDPHGRRGARRPLGRLRRARRGRAHAPRAARRPARRGEAGARRRGLVSRRRRRRRHARPAVRRRSGHAAGRLGPDRLAGLPLSHQAGVSPGHRQLGPRLSGGVRLLLPAEALAAHVAPEERGGGGRRSAHASRALRRRHARGRRRVPDPRPRPLGADPRPPDRGGPRHRTAGRDARRRRRSRRRPHRQVPRRRHPAPVRGGRVRAAGEARRHAQAPPRRGLAPRDRAPQQGRHHHRDVVPLRLSRGHAGDRGGDAAALVRVRARPRLLPGGDAVALRGLVRGRRRPGRGHRLRQVQPHQPHHPSGRDDEG